MKNLFKLFTLVMVVSGATFVVGGCGNAEADAKKAMETDTSTVDKNKQAREIFNNVGGDVNKLTAEDKAKLKSLYGPTLDVNGLFAAMSRKVAMPGPPPGK